MGFISPLSLNTLFHTSIAFRTLIISLATRLHLYTYHGAKACSVRATMAIARGATCVSTLPVVPGAVARAKFSVTRESIVAEVGPSRVPNHMHLFYPCCRLPRRYYLYCGLHIFAGMLGESGAADQRGCRQQQQHEPDKRR